MSVAEAPAVADKVAKTSRRERRSNERQAAPVGPVAHAVSLALAVLLGLLVWLIAYAYLFSGLQERHTQAVLYSHLRQELALATVPIGGNIKPGTPIALLTAPSIGLKNTVVVEGTASSQLEDGPGHFPASPLPGQAGTSYIFGRSATFGAPFGSITSLHVGAPVQVITGQATLSYTVLDVRQAGDPLPPALEPGQSRLTLVSSTASGWRSGWAPTQPVYVDLQLSAKDKVQPSPGVPTSVAANNLEFRPDTSRLIPLVLWLELAAGGAVFFSWAWHRWSARQLWLVGIPIGLFLLWGTSSAALVLLPNLI